MPEYNFKKKVKLYVVIGTLRYLADIYPDLTFSQTFNEESRSVKTLHTQTDMFDSAVITKANPLNFNFTMPLYTSMELKPIIQLLLDYDTTTSETLVKTADIYVDTGTQVFKLEKCVMENGVFNIVKDAICTLSLSGTGSKLSKFTGTIPGTLQTIATANSTILYPKFMEVMVGGVVQPHITSVSIEVTNQIEWVENNTIHKSLAVTGASDTVYPEAFVVSKRNVSGAVQQYVTDVTNANVNTWSVGASLSIKVARTQNTYTLNCSLPQVVYTNRVETGDLFIQSYDFRLTSNPTNLSTVISYT